MQTRQWHLQNEKGWYCFDGMDKNILNPDNDAGMAFAFALVDYENRSGSMPVRPLLLSSGSSKTPSSY